MEQSPCSGANTFSASLLHIVNPECLLLFSKELATRPYPEPHEFSQRLTIQF